MPRPVPRPMLDVTSRVDRVSGRLALVVALLSLVVALGGTSYAALALAKNSVTSATIKNNTVTTADVKNGTLLAKDFKSGQLPAGASGATGATGAQGPPGPAGPAGPSGVAGPGAQFLPVQGTYAKADWTYSLADGIRVRWTCDVSLAVEPGGSNRPYARLEFATPTGSPVLVSGTMHRGGYPYAVVNYSSKTFADNAVMWSDEAAGFIGNIHNPSTGARVWVNMQLFTSRDSNGCADAGGLTFMPVTAAP